MTRYLLAGWVHSLWEGKLPLGTLLVNMLGSFLIGIIFGWIASRNGEHPAWLHPLAITGFLGAFTTFSSFALDTRDLFQTSPALAIANIAISVIGSLIAVWLGFKLAA